MNENLPGRGRQTDNNNNKSSSRNGKNKKRSFLTLFDLCCFWVRKHLKNAHTHTYARLCATEQIQLQQVLVPVRGYFLLEETLIHDKRNTHTIFMHMYVCVYVIWFHSHTIWSINNFSHYARVFLL